MIVRLDRERQTQARRQLLSDYVYVLCHEKLKQLQRDGQTTLSPVELFLSAQKFCEVIRNLPDMMEGIDDEIEDLEYEAEVENDATLILALASVLMLALCQHKIGVDYQNVVAIIIGHLDGKDLFLPLIEQMTRKEDALWVNGKKSELLNYELKQIEMEGGGSEAVRKLFEDIIGYADKTDPQGIKEMLLFLNRYNIDHNHAYEKEIAALYDKLGMKSNLELNVGEYIHQKYVENEIQKVEKGGVGVKNIHKKPVGGIK